jgi:hypothetical protein
MVPQAPSVEATHPALTNAAAPKANSIGTSIKMRLVAILMQGAKPESDLDLVHRS